MTLADYSLPPLLQYGIEHLHDEALLGAWQLPDLFELLLVRQVGQAHWW